VVNKGDDAHRAPTPWTQQGIGLIDLLDELSPALFEHRRARRWGNLNRACGRSSLGWLLYLVALPSADIAVPAIIADRMFAQHGKHL